MSEISIDTLKTMLANLDDAKKYQSLRDVMETLPAPDLAAVFDQMLGLIRDALLVKTSRTDVSALISPAYTVKTLQGLCDGLAASTLIAWSRIIGDSLDRMRSAANRRVEAELRAVRLCSLGAENYDTARRPRRGARGKAQKRRAGAGRADAAERRHSAPSAGR